MSQASSLSLHLGLFCWSLPEASHPETARPHAPRPPDTASLHRERGALLPGTCLLPGRGSPGVPGTWGHIQRTQKGPLDPTLTTRTPLGKGEGLSPGNPALLQRRALRSVPPREVVRELVCSLSRSQGPARERQPGGHGRPRGQGQGLSPPSQASCRAGAHPQAHLPPLACKSGATGTWKTADCSGGRDLI